MSRESKTILSFKEFNKRNERTDRGKKVHFVFTSVIFLTEDKPCFSIRRDWFYQGNHSDFALQNDVPPQKVELVNLFTGNSLSITQVEETSLDGKRTKADVFVDESKGNVKIQTGFLNHPVVKDKVSNFFREAFNTTTKVGHWKAEDAIEVISAVVDAYLASTNDFFDKIFNDPKEVILEKMTQKFGKYHVQTKGFAGRLNPKQTRELTNGLPMVRLDEVEDKNYVRKNGEEDTVESKICEVLFYLEEKDS